MKKIYFYTIQLLAVASLLSCDPDNPDKGEQIKAGVNSPKIKLPQTGIVVSPFSGIVTPFDSAFRNYIEISPVLMTVLKVTAKDGTFNGTNYIHFPLTLPEGREINKIKLCYYSTDPKSTYVHLMALSKAKEVNNGLIKWIDNSPIEAVSPDERKNVKGCIEKELISPTDGSWRLRLGVVVGKSQELRLSNIIVELKEQ